MIKAICAALWDLGRNITSISDHKEAEELSLESGQFQNALLSSTYTVEHMPRCGLVYI